MTSIDPAGQGIPILPRAGGAAVGQDPLGPIIARFLSSTSMPIDQASLLATRAFLEAGIALEGDPVAALRALIAALPSPEGAVAAAAKLLSSGIPITARSLQEALSAELTGATTEPGKPEAVKPEPPGALPARGRLARAKGLPSAPSRGMAGADETGRAGRGATMRQLHARSQEMAAPNPRGSTEGNSSPSASSVRAGSPGASAPAGPSARSVQVGPSARAAAAIGRYLAEAELPSDEAHFDACRALLLAGEPLASEKVDRLARLLTSLGTEGSRSTGSKAADAAARLVSLRLPVTASTLQAMLLLEEGNGLARRVGDLERAVKQLIVEMHRAGLDTTEEEETTGRLFRMIEPGGADAIGPGGADVIGRGGADVIGPAITTQGRSLENRLAGLLAGREGPETLGNDPRALLARLATLGNQVAAEAHTPSVRTAALAMVDGAVALSDALLALQLQNSSPAGRTQPGWLVFQIPMRSGQNQDETVEIRVGRRNSSETGGERRRFSFAVRRDLPGGGIAEAHVDVSGKAVACRLVGDESTLPLLAEHSSDLVEAIGSLGYTVGKVRIEKMDDGVTRTDLAGLDAHA